VNEWLLQEMLRPRWLIDGVLINDEPHLLAGWEVMGVVKQFDPTVCT
jgi:hypothetical protein